MKTTRRHVRRRYRRNLSEGPATRRTARRQDVSCAEFDSERLEELVQARVRKLFGASLEHVAPDPVLRAALHDAIAKGLRQPPSPIRPDMLEVVERLREDGITVTPATVGPHRLPIPVDLGFSLAEAVLEERYGRA
jgi:hypothetical protein